MGQPDSHRLLWVCSAIDLLEQLLQFDERLRPTTAEVLNHPYLRPYHDPSDEVPCTQAAPLARAASTVPCH